jgi:uncharacterized membrane protein YvbJ
MTQFCPYCNQPLDGNGVCPGCGYQAGGNQSKTGLVTQQAPMSSSTQLKIVAGVFIAFFAVVGLIVGILFLTGVL